MSNLTTIPGSAVNNGSLPAEFAVVDGWVSSPNSRGTMDIIQSSFLTIFLCTWTVICLNIPAADDEQWLTLWRRVRWMFWAIVGPEIVLTIAIGQLASARRSVKRFRSLGHSKWTLRHGFFADMGGFMLETNDDHPSFPVNSRQVAYLVERGYLQCPGISDEDIWDKSKADAMAKLLAIAQASWMLLSLLGRAILQMSTTTLELSAGTIVFCTFGTMMCWFHKPSDVRRPVILSTQSSISQILIDAGDAASQPYRHTPLDFVAKQSFTCGYEVMGFFRLRCDDRRRPLARIPNDRFPDISTIEKFALFCMTTAYSALHLIAWNFPFVTKLEAQLWRASTLVMAGATVVFWVVETVLARQRFGRWDKYWQFISRIISILSKKTNQPTLQPCTLVDQSTLEQAIAKETEKHNAKPLVHQNTMERMDAFETEQQKSKPLPAIEVLLILPIVLSYVVARGYLIAEPLLGLRQLPLQTFATFQVAQLLPHW